MAWPLTADAQQPARKSTADDSEGRAHIAAFRQELETLGWIEGRNIRTVLGWTAGSIDNMLSSAKEMVEQKPELIVAETTPVVAALTRESRTMPIVFVNVSDPIASGFVASLPHPGSMITGFVSTQPALGSRWAQLLREIAPGVSRLGVMFNPDTAPYADGFVHSAEAAAVSMGAKLIAVPVHNDGEIERAPATLGGEPGAGLIVLPEATTNARSALMIELAARHRVPAVYGWQFEARSGGLLSYGLDLAESYRGAATYVNRILKGEKPVDLPVQLPTRYPMVIILKTAKALGLTIPPTLLAIADEVIDERGGVSSLRGSVGQRRGRSRRVRSTETACSGSACSCRATRTLSVPPGPWAMTESGTSTHGYRHQHAQLLGHVLGQAQASV